MPGSQSHNLQSNLATRLFDRKSDASPPGFCESHPVNLISAFTCQGRLSTGATSANGLYEITFTLYDEPTNGMVLGGQTVAPVDAAGVALAAIQGLNQKFEAENQELRDALRAQEAELAALQTRLGQIESLLRQAAAVQPGKRLERRRSEE
jgi:hypothetical protein